MPELPEVETVLRGLEPVMAGCAVQEVQVNRYDLRFPVDSDLPSLLCGQRVLSLKRRGKYILIFFSNNKVVVLHLGMSGRIRIVEPGQNDEVQKHDHVVFVMESGVRIIFNDARRFGFVILKDAESWQDEAPFSFMGPEPLEVEFDGGLLGERLRGRSSSIKSALLDQKIVAGLGNIYVCEALYEVGIHPEAKAGSVNGALAGRLAQAIRGVLEGAVEAGGSTLKDHRQTDGSMGYFQHSFSVYDREGLPCLRCEDDSAIIQRIVQSGRSTFYCPACQKQGSLET